MRLYSFRNHELAAQAPLLAAIKQIVQNNYCNSRPPDWNCNYLRTATWINNKNESTVQSMVRT